MSETQPAFSVRPVYDRHTDSLMVYLADAPSYGKDCGNGVSVFLAADDGRVVGVEISSVASIVAVDNAPQVIADDLFPLPKTLRTDEPFVFSTGGDVLLSQKAHVRND